MVLLNEGKTIEVIITVDGVGYKGVFNDIMTQKEILDQIRFAFKKLKLFPKEDKEVKFEIVKPKEEKLEVLEQVSIVE